MGERHTRTGMVVGMIREAMEQYYESEYDAVIATVRIYAIAFMTIIILIVSAVLL